MMRLSAPLLLASLLASTSALAQPRPADLSQHLLDELIAVSGVPGAGAAVWKEGKIAWAGSAGYRDLDRKLPVTEDTIFRLASVSKLLAATAAAKLHEQGKLDIDAPVTETLPWLKNGWAPITARQLAGNISGLDHYLPEDESLGATYYPTGRAAVAIFEQRPLLQAPGEKYVYSSFGFTLLGTIVEEVSGMPYPDYVTRHVTPGLKVVRDATDGPDPNASIAYVFDGREPRRAAPNDFSYTWGGGGMGATPAALVGFGGRMLGNEIVSAKTFEWMLQPARLNDGREAEDDGYRIGFGWRTLADEDGQRTAFHNGITDGARSTLVLWPEHKVAVSLLTNALFTVSIDRSARMIAAPHRPLPKGLVATPCPVKAISYSGSFAGQPVSGTTRFAVKDGLCAGRIEATGELKRWLSQGAQSEAGELRLVGLDRVAGLARAGLVTPYGIYDWRAQPDGSFKVPFGGTRELIVRLD